LLPSGSGTAPSCLPTCGTPVCLSLSDSLTKRQTVALQNRYFFATSAGSAPPDGPAQSRSGQRRVAPVLSFFLPISLDAFRPRLVRRLNSAPAQQWLLQSPPSHDPMGRQCRCFLADSQTRLGVNTGDASGPFHGGIVSVFPRAIRHHGPLAPL
jgi:hypothetical protein